jgi:hypothetical protein
MQHTITDFRTVTSYGDYNNNFIYIFYSPKQSMNPKDNPYK